MTEGREPDAAGADRQHLVGRGGVNTLHRTCRARRDRRVQQQTLVALNRLANGQRVVQRDRTGSMTISFE